MKNPLLIITLVSSFSMSVISCNKNDEEVLPIEPVPIELSADQVQLINSGNEFAFDIFRKVVENSGAQENIIISPLSISVALSMVLNGAEGPTRDAILKALRTNGISTDAINTSYKDLADALLTVDKRVLISIANSVWTEQNFPAKKEFIDKLTEYYDAETKSFSKSNPSAAVKEVNDWIDDKTNGLIKNMLDDLDPNTVMLLINAIYFNGKWNSQFDKSKTIQEPFYLSDSQSSDAPMMKQTSKYKVYEGDDLILAEMPYGQGNYVMDVILPEKTEDLYNIIRTLTQESFDGMTESMVSREVDLSFPRFKYGFKKELKDILTIMGMGVAFSDFADFSGISDVAVLISYVLHQAFIDTNEEGTEAAAVTIVGINTTSLPPDKLFLKLDHPFIYIIRETTTNSIIFMGRVSDPNAQ